MLIFQGVYFSFGLQTFGKPAQVIRGIWFGRFCDVLSKLFKKDFNSIIHWLVVEPTHLKNISQNGNLPQIGLKIKYIWNHHLVHHHDTRDGRNAANHPTYMKLVVNNGRMQDFWTINSTIDGSHSNKKWIICPTVYLPLNLWSGKTSQLAGDRPIAEASRTTHPYIHPMKSVTDDAKTHCDVGCGRCATSCQNERSGQKKALCIMLRADFRCPPGSFLEGYIYIPGTQMTLVLVGKVLVLGDWPSKIEVIGAPQLLGRGTTQYITIKFQCTTL